MKKEISRRKFIKASVAAGLTASVASTTGLFGRDDRKVRVGFVGVGSQGTNLLRTSLAMDDIEVPALCDINPEHLGRAQRLVERAGRPKPDGYSSGPEDFKRMSTREDLDAVITATPWELHVPVMVDAMNNGKYGCTEVPAAYTVEDCWQLVDTSERTGVPCMMLENHCYQRNNTAVLLMVRAGLFGELLHGECGYQHALSSSAPTASCSGAESIRSPATGTSIRPTAWVRWPISWISAGATISTTSQVQPPGPWDSITLSARNSARTTRLHIVTTTIRTYKGLTITINHDTQSPRPYSNMTKIQGTRGLYNELAKSVYIEDLSPQEHQWEPFDKYEEQYLHPMWKEFEQKSKDFGHGGTDYIKLRSFYEAVKDRRQTPIDVYDSVLWSVITPLSEQSVATGSMPVKFPDFTRGKWKTNERIFGL